MERGKLAGLELCRCPPLVWPANSRQFAHLDDSNVEQWGRAARQQVSQPVAAGASACRCRIQAHPGPVLPFMQAPQPAAEPMPASQPAIMVAYADAGCFASANLTDLDADLSYFGGEEPPSGAESWVFRRVGGWVAGPLGKGSST